MPRHTVPPVAQALAHARVRGCGREAIRKGRTWDRRVDLTATAPDVMERYNALPDLSSLGEFERTAPVGVFVPEGARDDSEASRDTIENLECTICYEPLGEEWIIPCKNYHAFHRACLAAWIRQEAATNGLDNVHCPDCRTIITYPHATGPLRNPRHGQLLLTDDSRLLREHEARAWREELRVTLLRNNWPYTPDQEIRLLNVCYKHLFLRNMANPVLEDPEYPERPIPFGFAYTVAQIRDRLLYGYDYTERRRRLLADHIRDLKDVAALVEMLRSAFEAYRVLPTTYRLIQKRLQDLGGAPLPEPPAAFPQ